MLADLIMLGYYAVTTIGPFAFMVAIYHHLPRYRR